MIATNLLVRDVFQANYPVKTGDFVESILHTIYLGNFRTIGLMWSLNFSRQQNNGFVYT